MSLQVIVSEKAWETHNAIYEQIVDRLGKKAASDFDVQTLKILRLLGSAPYMFKEVEGFPNVRKGLIKKIYFFFYEVKEDQIEILFFWDNRQEPHLY